MLTCFQSQENISISIKIVSKWVYKRDISTVWNPLESVFTQGQNVIANVFAMMIIIMVMRITHHTHKGKDFMETAIDWCNNSQINMYGCFSPWDLVTSYSFNLYETETFQYTESSLHTLVLYWANLKQTSVKPSGCQEQPLLQRYIHKTIISLMYVVCTLYTLSRGQKYLA